MEREVHVYCTNPKNKARKVLVVFTEAGYLVAQLHINPYLDRVFVELQDFSGSSKVTLIFINGAASGQNVSQFTPWLDRCRDDLPEFLRGLL